MKTNLQYTPLQFIEELNEQRHMVLLYDSPQYGALVKYNFIEKGLKKGEHSIVLTHDDVKTVRDEMESFGIDIQKYLGENLLHIYQIEDISKNPDGLVKGFNNLVKKITEDSKPPYRLIGTLIPDVSTKDGIVSELFLERLFHSNFSKFHCSFLCIYKISDLEKNKHSKWLTELIQNHHHVIYATDPKKSVVFESNLLEKG